MMKQTIWFAVLLTIQLTALAETITLSEAIETARRNSPMLQAARLQTEAAEKQANTAGLIPNPSLEFESEGVGGDNERFEEAEYTLKLEQKFLPGGKRRKDKAVARQSIELSRFTELEKAMKLETEIRRTFIELMAQQEIGKVRSEQEELARAFIEVAKRRLQAGNGSELEVVQAELALEEIKLAQSCCFGDLKAEQEKLSSLLNIPLEKLPEASGLYYELKDPGTLALDETFPALQQLDALTEQLLAKAERAKANDIPDISLGAGIKHEAADEINTFLFSVSIPLNFNRRGRIEHAAELLKAEALKAEREETRRKLQRELNSLLAIYNGTVKQTELIENDLIPKAEQTYELSRKNHEAGRFSWQQLIEAQQNLAEIRITHIETLREAHLLYAELSKFINQGL